VALSTAPKVRLRMPIGGSGGGPLEVVLTQQDLERLSAGLFRRARLPIDQACWQVCPDWPRLRAVLLLSLNYRLEVSHMQRSAKHPNPKRREDD